MCNLECEAVIFVDTSFPKAYVSLDKVVVTADGLLRTSTLSFAVSSCPAALLLLFCFCPFAFQVVGSLKMLILSDNYPDCISKGHFVLIWALVEMESS